MLMESVQSFFQQLVTMQLSDYIDIILVAFVIFKFMPLLRSSGASRIAKVVIGFLIVAWLANQFDLYTISFLLNQLLTIGVLALVILFQPELRRMLDHLGSVKLKNFLGKEEEDQEMVPVITQTVRACEVMSRERVGALIVFARDNGLDEYFKTGTMIEAKVSEQLIRNVFFPRAALHDGAMIIRDHRITAAGCVLPLSESSHLHADLGTRHRAGVGISEVSDAVVVIVSEETGAISVAVGGMLKRHLAPQTLERLLRNELCHEDHNNDEKLVVKLRQKLHIKEKEDNRNEK